MSKTVFFLLFKPQISTFQDHVCNTEDNENVLEPGRIGLQTKKLLLSINRAELGILKVE